MLLVHVLDSLGFWAALGVRGGPASIGIGRQAALEAQVAAAMHVLRKAIRAIPPGVSCDVRFARGELARELAAIADEQLMIVVGCRGLSALRPDVLGSISLSLARRAPRPVVVVPPGVHAAQKEPTALLRRFSITSEEDSG